MLSELKISTMALRKHLTDKGDDQEPYELIDVEVAEDRMKYNEQMDTKEG